VRPQVRSFSVNYGGIILKGLHMPRSARKVPSYCHHKASGRAVVRIDGNDHYLGTYGSDESHARYQAIIAEWRARQQAGGHSNTLAPQWPKPRFLPTIAELIARYKDFATDYYSWNGAPTRELQAIRYSLRTLRKLYGNTPAAEFGPLALKAVRQAMIELGWCRQLINRRVNRIKRFFKWAVSEDLIPSSVFESLRTVDGLRYGRSSARESAPVRPVDDAIVTATLPFLSPQVAAMVQLQRLTGMRPGEVIQMRPVDILRDTEVWTFEPPHHKNRWRGHQRLVPLGPLAQAILQPFLARAPEDHCFQPCEAEAWRNAERRKKRRTPMTPSQEARSPKTLPRKKAGNFYCVDAYRKALDYGIRKAIKAGAAVTKWHPNQLRHARATELRKKFGIEAAQVALGHSHAAITEVYAERNFDKAVEIARNHG